MKENRKTLVLVSGGTFLSSISGSMLSLALPGMARTFEVDMGTISWVMNAFFLACLALLLPAGRFGDRYGQGFSYRIGLYLLTVSSALGALATSLSFLLFARFLQGLATAFLMSAGPAILTVEVGPQKRGKALGLVSTATYVGLALGPPIGGLLLALFNWHALFWLMTVLGVLLCMASLVIRAAGARGQVASTSASLLRDREFLGAALAAVFNYWALFMSVMLIPFLLLNGHRMTQAHAGLILSVQPVVMAAMAPLSGSLSDRLGTARPAMAGQLISLLAFLLLSLGPVHLSLPLTAVACGLLGLGTGIFVAPNSSALMGSAPHGRKGEAGAFLAMARMLGQLAGASCAAPLFALGGGSGTAHAWTDAEFSALTVPLVASAVLSLAAALTSLWRGRASA